MASTSKQLPVLITIFGAKGDLTRRKLIPALYNLFLAGRLPDRYAIYCVDFLDTDEKTFKQDLLAGVNDFSRNGKAERSQWDAFASRIFYLRGDFKEEIIFSSIREKASAFDTTNKERGSRLFYFAVAPRFIETIAEGLSTGKLCSRINLDRIIVEKPFGTDLESAKKLNAFLTKRFAEKQIYRIDHYLGKEMVQNIIAFRFANYIFEPIWNNRFIDHVQINVAEEVGVGKRGGYYDSSGALRDMVQNHLLQVLCIVAMECPTAYKAELIRDAKTNVLKKIRKYSEAEVFKNVVRAQYTAGTVNDRSAPAYREEEQVAKESVTETFVTAKFYVDNKRWQGVPFVLSTGKSLPRQVSVVVIQFKDSPHKIFKDDVLPNRLVIHIQPELEIRLLFESKVPGLQMKLEPVDMDFTYKDAYTESLPEAYEALLLDAINGDPTLFMRADQVETAWKVVMPIIKAWKKNPRKGLQFYQAGTWGPRKAFDLLKPHGEKWFLLPGVEKVVDQPTSEAALKAEE